MAKPRGCLKNGCFGCLGLVAILFIIVVVISLLALNDVSKSMPREEVLAGTETQPDPGMVDFSQGGKVTLDISSGEFYVHPAKEGEGLRVEAVYDDAIYDLEQNLAVLPDSTWEYSLNFRQTESGMRALFQSIFTKGPKTKLHIFLPRDIPVELVTNMAKGGCEADLGGLWLTSVDLKAHQGGFAMEISEPLKEPLSHFRIDTNMGGFAATGLGNASPRILDINCSMGGADVRLDGAWLNDCDASFAVKFGGLSVTIPDDVQFVKGAAEAPDLERGEQEVPLPLIRIQTRAKYGEVDILH